MDSEIQFISTISKETTEAAQELGIEISGLENKVPALDIAATKRLEAVGKIVGIKLLDHIIVGCDSYVSLRSEGIIEQDS